MEEVLKLLLEWGKLPVEVVGVILLVKILTDLRLIKVRLGIVEKKNGIEYPKEMIP